MIINNPCQCGSGEYPIRRYDGYGIYLCAACTKCWPEKRKHYRPDIFEHYDAFEPIDAED